MLMDDIYEHTVYDNFRFVTLAALEPTLRVAYHDLQRHFRGLRYDRLASDTAPVMPP